TITISTLSARFWSRPEAGGRAGRGRPAQTWASAPPGSTASSNRWAGYNLPMLKTILVSLLLLGSLHAQQPGAGRGAGAVAQRTPTIEERTAGMQKLDG